MKTKKVYFSKNKKLLKEQIEKDKTDSEKSEDFILLKKIKKKND